MIASGDPVDLTSHQVLLLSGFAVVIRSAHWNSAIYAESHTRRAAMGIRGRSDRNSTDAEIRDGECHYPPLLLVMARLESVMTSADAVNLTEALEVPQGMLAVTTVTHIRRIVNLITSLV